ncbi:MAG: hypothetical protein V1926_01885 [Candidatus Peregrinibacteria bacterium]
MQTIRFEFLLAFQKEFARLSRKFRSLPADFEYFKQYIITPNPAGPSQHRTVLYRGEGLCIVKGHLFCRSLRRDSLRIIYAYHADRITIVWIEVYHKAEKANEDRARIAEYVRSLG